jgi:hypothetical protein
MGNESKKPSVHDATERTAAYNSDIICSSRTSFDMSVTPAVFRTVSEMMRAWSLSDVSF